MTNLFIDWHELHAGARRPPAVVDPRRRLRICCAVAVGLLAVVFVRVVQLEWSQGAAFREAAARPLVRRHPLPGVRGRILSSDGAVLACDRQSAAVAVYYRYLEEPCDPAWLRSTARARLAPAERKRPERVAEVQRQVEQERRELAARLQALCRMPAAQWERRRAQIQARVERIVADVRRRQSSVAKEEPAAEKNEEPASLGESLRRLALRWLKSSVAAPPPGRLVVAEERDYHVMADEVPPDVAAEVEGHADRYRGVKILAPWRRAYPAGALAAHVLGHVGRGDSPLPSQALPDYEGRMGVERRYEELLRGTPGTTLELTDHGGRVLSSRREREPIVGRDLVLTLDARVQSAAEDLLDQAVRRRDVTQAADAPSTGGGAIVVMDVSSGALLAAASAPRFDPNWFSRPTGSQIETLLGDPRHPLVDRVAAMALPPGSVFKIVTATALLESKTVQPDDPFTCRGYLGAPDRWRCASFVRHGQGHGEVTLVEALARSCNVYFFEHARQMGPGLLLDWAQRFGFGEPVGVDLPSASRGTLPGEGDRHIFQAETARKMSQSPASNWPAADTLELSIGQGRLTASPLQVARLMAAVANGGRLVTPHVASRSLSSSAEPIPGLHASTLQTIREGLVRGVADPRGTAHGTVYSPEISLAGKTGTAQCGPGQADHAWFAGYLPAERPRWALVVVLEHGGDGSTSAGPVVKRLAQQIARLGLLDGRSPPNGDKAEQTALESHSQSR